MTEYKPDPLPFEELMSLPSYSMPTLSKDKQKLAFYWDVTGRIELYVLVLKTKEIIQVSDGQLPRAPRTGFTWDKEGKKIFFGKDDGGNEQNDIWVIDVQTKEVKALTNTPKAQEHVVEVSNDNQWLSFISTRAGQMNVFKMKLDDSEVTQLSAADVPVFGGKWSPDDKWMIMNTNEMKTNLENEDIYLYNNETKDLERIIRIDEKGSHDNFSDWHPDGKIFSFISDASGLNQVGTYNIETKDIKWLSTSTYDEFGGVFSPSGKYIAVIRNHEATLQPIIYNSETGQMLEIDVPPGLTYNLDFVDDDKLLFYYTSNEIKNDIWIYDITTNKYEVLLESNYGSIDKSKFVVPEYIKYKSFDGQKIAAFVFAPKNIPEGVKLPAIVDVHGGPTGQYFMNFSATHQYVASEGFVVILPNIRGSTGYGVAFRDACLKDWGGLDLKDVVSAAEYLKSLPFVDSKRIGVGGGSYGGFMTFIAVTKAPEYWKAGFAWIGISDFFSFYEESMPHFKYFINRQMGNPIDDKDLWYDRSAVNFVQNMTAKLLIFHGVNDPRCPISQARIFRDKLLEFGKIEGENFEYMELDEVGHGGFGDIKTRMLTIRTMVDFFKRNL